MTTEHSPGRTLPCPWQPSLPSGRVDAVIPEAQARGLFDSSSRLQFLSSALAIRHPPCSPP